MATQIDIHIPTADELRALQLQSKQIQNEQLTKLSLQVSKAIPIPAVQKAWSGIVQVGTILAPIARYITDGLNNMLGIKSQEQRIADSDMERYNAIKNEPYFYVAFYDPDFTQIARVFDGYNIIDGALTKAEFDSGHFIFNVFGKNIDLYFNAPNGFSTSLEKTPLTNKGVYYLFPNVLTKYIDNMAYQNQINEAKLLAALYLQPSQLNQWYAGLAQQGPSNFYNQYSTLNSDQKNQYFAQLASTIPITSEINNFLSTIQTGLGNITQQQWIEVGIGVGVLVLILVILE